MFFFSETPVWDMTRQVATMRIGVATVLHAARTILLGVTFCSETRGWSRRGSSLAHGSYVTCNYNKVLPF